MKFFERESDSSLFLKLTSLGLLLYFFSFLGYLFPILNTFIFFLILLAVLLVSVKNLELGVFAVLFEVAIGVKGYLFSFAIFGFPVSIRLALFVGVFLIWLFFTLRKDYEVVFAKSKLFPIYAVFTLMLIIGMISGVLLGNDIKNVFFDVNGYLYLAFIFPLYHVVRSIDMKKKMLLIVMSGAFALTIFSLFTAVEFTLFHQDSRPDLAQAISSELAIDVKDKEQSKISHSVTAKDELRDNFSLKRQFENEKPAIYRWTQDVSVAEISYLAGPFFRVFSPGQVYSLFLAITALFVLFNGLLKVPFLKVFTPDISRGIYWAMGVISFIAVALGFSRSLWLGLLASIVIFGLFIPFKKAITYLLIGVVALFIFGLSIKSFAPDAYALLSLRVLSIVNPSSESAGSNRINVIGPAIDVAKKNVFFGSGFGTTVEYESVVPEKYGTLRVFAFEWSYIDMVIEVGLFGLTLYLFFIFKIYQLLGFKRLVLFQAVILALLITNIATPFLNHPLGIGLLLISAALTRKDAE